MKSTGTAGCGDAAAWRAGPPRQASTQSSTSFNEPKTLDAHLRSSTPSHLVEASNWCLHTPAVWHVTWFQHPVEETPPSLVEILEKGLVVLLHVVILTAPAEAKEHAAFKCPTCHRVAYARTNLFTGSSVLQTFLFQSLILGSALQLELLSNLLWS